MTQHTPGPWTLANQGHDGWAIYVRRFGVIALMGSFDAHPEPQAEQAANVRLIAASPQLLAALKTIVDTCDDPCGSDKGESLGCAMSRMLPAARAAIAAATGTPT